MTATKRLTAGADVAAGRWVVVVLDDGRFSRAPLAAQGIELPDHLDEPTGNIPPDDLLDAAAAAWTAWRCATGRGEALSEPDSAPPLTERGVIWF